MKGVTILACALVLLPGCSPVVENDTSESGMSAAEITTLSGVSMVRLAGGSFVMGNAGGDADEQPEHTVTVSAFAIDKFEVTHEQFDNAQLPNPSKWKDDPHKPVNQVRWRDAKQYCNERSLMEDLTPCYDESTPGWPCDFAANGYRLPTEAEWEYAAKAGTGKPYDFGDSSKLAMHSVFADNSNQQTAPVGATKPNSWGISDLYGNVSEWCHDVFDPNYYASSPKLDPNGPDPTELTEANPKRVIRGGSWKSTASMCRNTFRQGQTTGDTDACFSTDFCGFRCVRRLSESESTRFVNAVP
ncbi:MAG: sulfatase activating formylglycine-generating enzyme [Verrucomicrobiales bacterium]|jgi:formylglycine-generating enzyme required for sulfatase activity